MLLIMVKIKSGSVGTMWNITLVRLQLVKCIWVYNMNPSNSARQSWFGGTDNGRITI